jgi:hypothetical protein
MDKYFNEITRRIASEALKTEETNGLLAVTLNGRRLCRISSAGTLYYPSDYKETPEARDSYKLVSDVAYSAHEYVSAMEKAPLLKAADLSDGYRLLCDFNGYVLAGTELSKNMGYQFVTWQYSYDRKGVGLGHYFMNDFEGAKEDFVQRAELMPKEKLFSDEQYHALYATLFFCRNNDPNLTFEQDKMLEEIQRQIEKAAPDAAALTLDEAAQGLSMTP